MKTPIKERILRADVYASRHLGDANEAQERGDKHKAEKLYRLSQFWLDRYNLLVGNTERKPPNE